MLDEGTTATPTEEAAPTPSAPAGTASEEGATEPAQLADTPSEEAKGEEHAEAEEQPDPLPEGWQDHPDTQAHLQATRDEAFRNAQSEFDQKLSKKELELEAKHADDRDRVFQEATAGTVVQKVTDGLAKVGEFIEAGDAEAMLKELGKVLKANERWAGVFQGANESRIRQEARAPAIGEAAGLFLEGLPKPVQDALAATKDDLNLKLRARKLTIEDAFTQLVAKAFEQHRELTEKEVAGMAAQRGAEEERAAEREKKPAPVNTNGRGRAKSIDTSEGARLARLAYGKDDAGNAPTEADREWLAARN